MSGSWVQNTYAALAVFLRPIFCDFASAFFFAQNAFGLFARSRIGANES
jgi:hypothetical protein